ncbi:MAG: Arylesterase precursor [Candidatus Hydrogenedentes bacterium ADurb.Bin101]|nr:MAG: Arylesterase precursor [Candidatus Hydrogenedentes bacterium ADurb.Bin101]
MIAQNRISVVVLVFNALLMLLPVMLHAGTTVDICGESIVLATETPGNLCFNQIVPGTVVVRNAYDPEKEGMVIYESERDYVVDCVAGTIVRTPGSRIPDFSANLLYGKKEFDHNNFPGFGNTAFFVYVDYTTNNGATLYTETDQSGTLKQTRDRLQKGGPFKVIAFGDSIACGGDATEERLQFTRRYAQWIQEQFPEAKVAFENGATGGDSTVSGLARLEEKVLTRAPDLVLLGFGMNDHNTGGPEPDVFHDNLVQIVKTIRERTGADVLMFSTFPPNPDWKFGSHRMERYAAATERAAKTSGCAFGDVYAVWMKMLERKDCSSMLGNNINHPSDFGHWLYFEVLKSVRF